MDVEFNDKNIYMKNNDIYNMRNPSRSKMSDFLIRKGIVKDEKQANVLLLIFSVFILIISIFIFSKYVFRININPGNKSNESELNLDQTPEDIERLNELRQQILDQENTKNNQ